MTFKHFRLGALVSLIAFPVVVYTQNAQIPSIVPLAGVHYRYWPKQLVQWIGPELPYSMIVLDVDDRGKQPIYDVELIDKNGRNVTHYTNTAEELSIDRRAGFTAYQVAMQFDGPADPEKGAQYMLRFNTETGVPVVWQFILGTDITDQGSGLSPIPAPIPILAYRTRGGLADQGTALKMGNTTSAADVWKEFAHPPYFVPYRGAFSTGIQLLSFVPESCSWHTDGQTLTDASNNSLSLARGKDMITISNNPLGTTMSYTFEGSSIARVSFAPAHGKREDTLTLQFSSPLAPASQSNFEIIAGKKTRIATGTVQLTDSNPQSQSVTWTFSIPEALKGKTVAATASLRP